MDERGGRRWTGDACASQVTQGVCRCCVRCSTKPSRPPSQPNLQNLRDGEEGGSRGGLLQGDDDDEDDEEFVVSFEELWGSMQVGGAGGGQHCAWGSMLGRGCAPHARWQENVHLVGWPGQCVPCAPLPSSPPPCTHTQATCMQGTQ